MKVKDIFGKFISTVPVDFIYKNDNTCDTLTFKNDMDFVATLSGSCYEEFEIIKIVSTYRAIIIISSNVE